MTTEERQQLMAAAEACRKWMSQIDAADAALSGKFSHQSTFGGEVAKFVGLLTHDEQKEVVELFRDRARQALEAMSLPTPSPAAGACTHGAITVETPTIQSKGVVTCQVCGKRRLAGEAWHA